MINQVYSQCHDLAHLRRMIEVFASGKVGIKGSQRTRCGRCDGYWPTMQEAWACHQAHLPPPINEVR